MAVMVGCTPPGPLLEGEGISPDSPAAARHPLSEGEGLAHEALEGIDSLMWVQPDSALKVMMEFAGSEAADSLDVFEGHYCQVLVAELLYKNDYGQSNRKDLQKAVRYFDSIDEGFLAARAHYMNGVGFYERDSVVAACGVVFGPVYAGTRHCLLQESSCLQKD